MAGRTRTSTLWFWRPLLGQLSFCHRSVSSCDEIVCAPGRSRTSDRSDRNRLLWSAELRTLVKRWQPNSRSEVRPSAAVGSRTPSCAGGHLAQALGPTMWLPDAGTGCCCMASFWWCAKRESNPHVLADTSPSGWRVCHSATRAWMVEVCAPRWLPQRDSNSRSRLERAPSWSSRRWGQEVDVASCWRAGRVAVGTQRELNSRFFHEGETSSAARTMGAAGEKHAEYW